MGDAAESLSVPQRDQVLLVTGANSLLGQHVVKHMAMYDHRLAEIRTLDVPTHGRYVKKLDFDSPVPVHSHVGELHNFGELLTLLRGVTAVIHLHEYKDVSAAPDERMLHSCNVDDTSTLLFACHTARTVRHIIVSSSTMVNVSVRKPSVWNPELAALPAADESPCPAYCSSKLQAEGVVLDYESAQTMVVRVPALYGECDTDSFIVHMLQCAEHNAKVVPVIGDKGGVYEFAYAGNVAWCIMAALGKMRSDPSATKEIVFTLDDTPKTSVYKLLEPMMEDRQLTMSTWCIPFPFYYYTYKLGTWLASMLYSRETMAQWPAADYLYCMLRHWVFFQWMKARVYLDYKPLYSYEQSVHNCRQYYAGLKLRSIDASGA